MKNLYSNDIKVLNWWISSWSWSHSIQINTEMWNTYKTSLFDQSSFEQLVSQNNWDKIKDIRVKTSYISNFKEADKISDWLKSKITDILTMNQ